MGLPHEPIHSQNAPKASLSVWAPERHSTEKEVLQCFKQLKVKNECEELKI